MNLALVHFIVPVNPEESVYSPLVFSIAVFDEQKNPDI
jgi:hypothetical protein